MIFQQWNNSVNAALFFQFFSQFNCFYWCFQNLFFKKWLKKIQILTFWHGLWPFGLWQSWNPDSHPQRPPSLKYSPQTQEIKKKKSHDLHYDSCLKKEVLDRNARLTVVSLTFFFSFLFLMCQCTAAALRSSVLLSAIVSK